MKNRINSVFFVACLLSILSCSKSEIIYEYRGITIKRIDTPGKSTFYYIEGDSQINRKIYSAYSGINEGFDGYLVFKDDGRVEILVGDGLFVSNGVDSALFSFRYVSTVDAPIIDTTTRIISFPIEKEIRKMKKYKSAISVNYN